MYKLENYIAGNWITGDGEGQLLFNAVTGEPFAKASTKGIDFKASTEYARIVGNPALRKMTFHQRGNMLKALAILFNLFLSAKKRVMEFTQSITLTLRYLFISFLSPETSAQIRGDTFLFNSRHSKRNSFS